MPKKTKSGEIVSQRELCRRLTWPWGTFKTRMADASWPVPQKGPWPAWTVDLLAKWADARYAKPAGDEQDPLLQGAASPQLERYRQYRADLLLLDLEQRRGNLILREEIHTALLRIMTRLRTSNETIAREFGNEAAAIQNEALDAAALDVQEMFGADGTPDTGGATA